MAQQVVNIGSAPNDHTGDPLRTAFDKLNDNCTELYLSSGIQLWTFPSGLYPTAVKGFQWWYTDAEYTDSDGFTWAPFTLLISIAAGTGSSNFIKKQ